MERRVSRVGRRSQSRSGLLGLGAFAAIFLMILSPSSASAAASLALHAPWRGVVLPNNSATVDACAAVSPDKVWRFHLKTGIGGGASSGEGQKCRNGASPSLYNADYASVSGGLSIGIRIRPGAISSTTTSVAMNAVLAESVALKASDGLASNTATPPACTGSNATIRTISISRGWNYLYNATQGNYAPTYYNSSYYTWYNNSLTSSGYGYGYSNAAAPAPFNLNNTSSEYYFSEWGAYANCYAGASFYIDQTAALVDATTGVTEAETNATYPNQWGVSVDTYEYVDWWCDVDWAWYGPSNYSYGSSVAVCQSYNTSFTSYVSTYSYSYVPTYSYASTYTTGSNNTQDWSGSATDHETAYWNDTFSSTDHYVLEIDLQTGADAGGDWAKGFESWDVNALSGGNGFRLLSLVIT